MRERPAAAGYQRQFRVVDPNGVGRAEAWTEQSDAIQICCQGGTIVPQCGCALHRQLRQMGLHGHIEFGGEVAAADQELLRTMQRDGRCDAEPDVIARIGPAGRGGADRGKCRFRRSGPHAVGNGSQLWRESVQQARNCLIKAAIGDHRRNHRPHTEIAIGAGDRVQTFHRRNGQHRREIVTRGATLT